MLEKLSNKRVKGFLRTEGTKVVNESGEEIILTGWGLGNWLLCEGYMWLAGEGTRFDRPRRIESVISELTGSSYAEEFWKKFRESYITREDIRLMAELGYNSVRIPLSWRLLMEEEPGINWKEDGFQLIDNCLDWCEEFGIYAFLDLHGAPGGQTGANIDDSVDDVPRLFIDQDNWDKAIELWKKLAFRYRDRFIVGGYDLLNEPIRPSYLNLKNFDYLLPKLVQFYEEATAAIRVIDKKHMLSIEGHHWATDISLFHKSYDDNMVIHFHRYGCIPSIEAYQGFLEVSKRLNAPLWLGETAENVSEWYTAMYPLSVSLGIGYNLWPWKKMNNTNSPCSIKKPGEWDKIIEYTHGGPHPGYKVAQGILDQYLENIKFNNCIYNSDVTKAVFRQPSCRVRGTDFDAIPGKGVSYSGLRKESNLYNYQLESGMSIISTTEMPAPSRFAFDCGWERFVLEMESAEFACYSIYAVKEGNSVTLELLACKDATITIFQNDVIISTMEVGDCDSKITLPVQLKPMDEAVIKICVNQGKIQLTTVSFT
ncbi:MAG: cellulase family glycosylhydrolase [Clostridiaceae bacterium]|nr:cellulase family glycosylhydrolase [Clostridiaceae bacterium]